MKKIITTAAITLTLLLSFSATAFAIAFTDIGGHVYEPDIKYIGDKGIVQGYDDGTYKPDALINRAEFTKIIIGAKLNGAPMPDAGSCFKDVKDEWFAIFVCYAKDNGIIKGYDDGNFHPSNDISIAEAAKIIIGGLMGTKITDTVGVEWYVPYMEKLSYYGAVPPTLKYKAADTKITRGEMAFMISTLLQWDSPRSQVTTDVLTAQGIVYGNAKAETSIVTFTDFECPFCKAFHPVLKKVVDESSGMVNLEYKNFALAMHPNAEFEARAGICAGKLGKNSQYWTFIDKLFAGSFKDMDALQSTVKDVGFNSTDFSDCVADASTLDLVLQDYKTGETIGVTGTPSSIIINNSTGAYTTIEGNQPEKVVTDAIAQLKVK